MDRMSECLQHAGITETANWVAGASAKNKVPEDGLIGTMWGGEAVVRQENGELVDQVKVSYC